MDNEFSMAAGKNAARALARSFDFEIPLKNVQEMIAQAIDDCDGDFQLADQLLALDTFEPKKKVSL